MDMMVLVGEDHTGEKTRMMIDRLCDEANIPRTGGLFGDAVRIRCMTRYGGQTRPLESWMTTSVVDDKVGIGGVDNVGVGDINNNNGDKNNNANQTQKWSCTSFIQGDWQASEVLGRILPTYMYCCIEITKTCR